MSKKDEIEYMAVTQRKEILEQIDAFVNSEEGRKRGYRSRSDFVGKAIQQLLAKETRPRFEHFNASVRDVRIIDHEIRENPVTVTFGDDGKAHCDYHESDDCEHVDYALSIPEVKEALKKEGWRRR